MKSALLALTIMEPVRPKYQGILTFTYIQGIGAGAMKSMALACSVQKFAIIMIGVRALPGTVLVKALWTVIMEPIVMKTGYVWNIILRTNFVPLMILETKTLCDFIIHQSRLLDNVLMSAPEMRGSLPCLNLMTNLSHKLIWRDFAVLVWLIQLQVDVPVC